MDGTQVGTSTTAGGINYAAPIATSTTLIGRHVSNSNYDFNGLIDDARIYTRALSADEIAALATDQTVTTDSVAITVNPVNDAPVITSDGGGSSAAINAAENQTAVTTVTSTDVDGGTPAYTISGGADSALFNINGSSGALTFATTPDFEVPTDANGDGNYEVTVQVGDGNGGFDTQAITVIITDVPDEVYINSNKDTLLDDDNQADNYGASASLTLDQSGVDEGDGRVIVEFDLSFIPVGATITGATLYLEATANTGVDQIDAFRLTESWVEGAGTGTPDDANWDERDGINSWSSSGGSYDNTAVATLNAGGAAGQHNWDVTTLVQDWYNGVLSNFGFLLGSPDAGGDTVTYDSREGTTPPQLHVTYDFTNQVPTITSDGGGAAAAINADENQTSVTTVTATDPDLPPDTLTYAILGGADAGLFTIGGTSGVLSFATTPDFETPTDADADGDYEVTVRVDDGKGGSDMQAITVTVDDINDVPVATGNMVVASEDVPLIIGAGPIFSSQ